MKPWIIAIRPKTLIIAVAVILLSHSLAYQFAGHLNWLIAGLTSLCILSLQTAVNMANDYFDGLSGIDNERRLGPPRALQSGLLSPKQLLTGLILVTAIACSSGIYLIWYGGWPFLLLGLLSLIGVFAYSYGRYSIANLGLGEVSVFFYFGWLGILSSYYLQTFQLSVALLLPASQLGALVAAVMLVNNIRDRSNDEDHGKHTLAVRLGPGRARMLYYLLILSPWLLAWFDPQASGWLFLCLPLSLWLLIMIGQRIGKDLNQQLSQTSLQVLLWSLCYSFGLLLS